MFFMVIFLMGAVFMRAILVVTVMLWFGMIMFLFYLRIRF
jgi:hypothetical protein